MFWKINCPVKHLQNWKQKAEKKWPIFSSCPEKLAILPGIKDLSPIIFDLKKSSKSISITTIRNIIDQILQSLLTSELVKLISNCLKDRIDPIIKINFNILGNVKKKSFEKTKLSMKNKNKKISKYHMELFRVLQP